MNLYKNKLYQSDLSVTCDAVTNLSMLKDKSVLITGASGLIGSYLVDTLVSANKLKSLNVKIYAVGRNLDKLKHRFNFVVSDNLYLLEQDVTKKIDINVRSVDFVIHAASNANPQKFSEDPVGTILSNVQGTLNLLQWSLKKEVSTFLYVSSGEIYGKLTQVDIPFLENKYGSVDQLNPRSCYPIAKRTAENLCVSFAKQYGLKTLVVRPSHIFGPNYTSSDSRVSAEFFSSVLAHEDIVLRSKGDQYRSYCYVSDCVSAMLTVLINGENKNAYNCTNTNNKITMVDFARKIAKFGDSNVRFEINKEIEKSAINIAVLSDEKVKALQWHPHFTINDGIKHTINILKN